MNRQANRHDESVFDAERPTSNASLLMIAGVFLAITVVLVLLKPGADETSDVQPNPLDGAGNLTVATAPTAPAQPVSVQPTPQEPATPAPSASVTSPGPIVDLQPVPVAPAPAAPSLDDMRARSEPPVVAPSAVTPQPAPVTPATLPPEIAQVVTDAEVTRMQAPLLGAVSAPKVTQPISLLINQQLRQPVRLTEAARRPTDLPTVAQSVLSGVSAPTYEPVDERLKSLLVDVILQRQSDTYATVLLNQMVSRAGKPVPVGVRNTGGDLDAGALLGAMLQVAGGRLPEPPVPVLQTSVYVVEPGDSLAGIAMRYYGRPLDYIRMLDANPQLEASGWQLIPGERLTVPAL